MSSGVCVFQPVEGEDDFIIRDFNRAAEDIEHITREEIIGRKVTEVFPGVKECGLFEILMRVRRTKKPEYYHEAFYQDFRNPGGWRENRVYSLPSGDIVSVYNDITERKSMEYALQNAYNELEARVQERTSELSSANNTLRKEISERGKAEVSLRNANRQLNLLSSITRHDINNNISVILATLGIAEGKVIDHVLEGYCTKIKQATNAIKNQIDFTRVYQDLGTHQPLWQDLGSVMPHLSSPVPVSLMVDLPDLEVYADPMLGRVFFNLLDNSVRHGGKVTEIKVYTRRPGDELLILWEDNGDGIPDDLKEQIFERGVGRNTGLGLFLVREVLMLTGMSIREYGEHGKGARFEIRVPGEYWRYHGSECSFENKGTGSINVP